MQQNRETTATAVLELEQRRNIAESKLAELEERCEKERLRPKHRHGQVEGDANFPAAG